MVWAGKLNDLATAYQQFEEEESWRVPELEPPEPKQYSKTQLERIWERLKENIRKRSIEESLTPEQYTDRLTLAYEWIRDIPWATNHEKHLENGGLSGLELYGLWSHQSFSPASPNTGLIWREELVRLSAIYLGNEWLQDEELDWLFLDSLLFAELSAYTQEVLSGSAVGDLHRAFQYALADGDMAKYGRNIIISGIVGFLLRYIIPLSILWYWYETGAYRNGFEFAIVIYGIYLGIRAIGFPFRVLEMIKKGKAYKKAFELVDKMHHTYQHVKPPVVDIKSLKASVENTRDAGAVYESAIYTLLGRLIERTDALNLQRTI